LDVSATWLLPPALLAPLLSSADDDDDDDGEEGLPLHRHTRVGAKTPPRCVAKSDGADDDDEDQLRHNPDDRNMSKFCARVILFTTD
jgi:hypothetical protein